MTHHSLFQINSSHVVKVKWRMWRICCWLVKEKNTELTKDGFQKKGRQNCTGEEEMENHMPERERSISNKVRYTFLSFVFGYQLQHCIQYLFYVMSVIVVVAVQVNAMLSLLHSHQNQSWITVLGSHSTAIDKISSAQHLYLSISQSLVTIDYHGTIISPCSSDISLYYRVVNRKTVLSGLFYNNC